MKYFSLTLLFCLALIWPLAGLATITCNVTATGVAFGVYNPLTGADLDSTGNVNFSCSKSDALDLTTNFPYSIWLSAGNGGTYVPRRMNAGANTMNYNLYRDAARTLIWGDGTGGSSVQAGSFTFPLTVLFGSVNRSSNHAIYGRLFGDQNVAVGSYADNITVTVMF